MSWTHHRIQLDRGHEESVMGGQNVVALVPARAGSRGLPGKNTALLGGLELVAWTFRAALSSPEIDLVVSSTDDPAVMRIADAYGVQILERPASLAGDTTTAGDVVMHGLEHLSHDILIYLQPTSPFRRKRDIRGALGLLSEPSISAVVSVTPAKHPPEWVLTLDPMTGFLTTRDGLPIPRRRQDSLGYQLNGAIYCAHRDTWSPDGDIFRSPVSPYVMDALHSVDIDDADDLAYAEYVLNAHRNLLDI
jgi:CMP-N,N'-diacetyllegionaminic acid synthase